MAAAAAPYAAPGDYPMELGGRYSLKVTTAAEDAGAVQTWFDRASLLTPALVCRLPAVRLPRTEAARAG